MYTAWPPCPPAKTPFSMECLGEPPVRISASETHSHEKTSHESLATLETRSFSRHPLGDAGCPGPDRHDAHGHGRRHDVGALLGRRARCGALGNSVSFGLITFPMGILMALDPLVAQAFGANSHERIGRHFKQGLLLAAALAIPLSAVMLRTESALLFSGQRPTVAADGAAYVQVIAVGNLPFLLFIVVRHTLQAMSLIRPAAIAIVIANGVNVLINYTLIFGHFGLPELGVVGSAWATAISRWVMLLCLVAAGWPMIKRYVGGSWRELMRLRAFLEPLRLGIPIGVQISFEMWMFAAVALMMGNLGARELAAHQIALTLSALSFMVPLGISGAAATRVGNAIGRGDIDGARRSAAVCLALGVGVMSASALTFVFAPLSLEPVVHRRSRGDCSRPHPATRCRRVPGLRWLAGSGDRCAARRRRHSSSGAHRLVRLLGPGSASGRVSSLPYRDGAPGSMVGADGRARFGIGPGRCSPVGAPVLADRGG